MVAKVEKKSKKFIFLFGILAFGLIAFFAILSKENFIGLSIIFGVIALTLFFIKLSDKAEREWDINPASQDNYTNIDLELEKQSLDRLLSHDYLIVDSNIWMEPKYTYFFEHLKYCLKNHSKKAVICGSQFDEICNIKTINDYGEKASSKARYAISLIESFQKDNILDIKGRLTAGNKKAYADPEILKIIRSATSKNKTIGFVTNDIELRIRAREIIKNHSMESHKIVDIENEFICLLDEEYCPHILDF